MRRQVNGILLLDKPTNMTSNGALQRVKRLFNAKKAGHTGSLDPIATGMLPLCFGEATKLGEKTTTGDSEGDVIATQPIINITPETIQAAFQKFLGKIEQIPPMYSAIKHQGKPLYKLARQGIEIERKARPVTIFSLDLLSVTDQDYSFEVHCSKGTYIRTLVEDLGQALNCVSHVSALRRTFVSPYGNTSMFSLEELENCIAQKGYAGLSACLLPLETAVQGFPAVKLSTSAAFYLRMGQPVRAPFQLDTSLVRLVSEDARFLGMGEVMSDGMVKPQRLLATQEG